MRIQCWGSRGAIPVSGKDYLKYGGDTTCFEIRTKSGETIIVDAGTGIRRLGNRLLEEERYAYHFLLTHSHWDHLMGFPFFQPLYHDRTVLRVHRCRFQREVRPVLRKVMEPPNFPVKYSELRARIIYEEADPADFEIGSVRVIPIQISHPDGGCGYKFIEDGKAFVFLTDNELGFVHRGGLTFQDYQAFSSGADLLIHDAEYTPDEHQKGWGHSVYTHVLDLALKSGVKKLGLFHLHRERTDQKMDEIVEACRIEIERRGSSLKCFAVACDMPFSL